MRESLIALCLLLLISGTAFAENPIELTVDTGNVRGSFDYYLYWPGSSQLLSKVSGPQSQRMTVVSAKLNLDRQEYITLQYGTTGNGVKGRGDDSDWTNQGSSAKTYYGTADYVGKQEFYNVDFGKKLSSGPNQTSRVFWGWSKHKTTNGISNVVYSLVGGQNVGSISQPDNGSYLNGEMDGFHVGLGYDFKPADKLTLSLEAKAAYLRMRAYGHWANHSPAWNWVDSGRTWGRTLSTSLRYDFDKQTNITLSYRYFRAKGTGMNESLDTGTGVSYLPGQVDLRYTQRSYFFGLSHTF